MDADRLREALSETEQHIADGERLIAEQRALAESAAERSSQYAADAKAALWLLEQVSP